jgi:hypothetical protein
MLINGKTVVLAIHLKSARAEQSLKKKLKQPKKKKLFLSQ